MRRFLLGSGVVICLLTACLLVAGVDDGYVVVRNYLDYSRNLGDNAVVTTSWSSPAKLWEVDDWIDEGTTAEPGYSATANSQPDNRLLVVAPTANAFAGDPEGPGSVEIIPQCTDGTYFYGIGITSDVPNGSVYRRLCSANSNTAYEALYTYSSGAKPYFLWCVGSGGLGSGSRLLAYDDTNQGVYTSTNGTTWTLIIGAYDSAEDLKFTAANSWLWDQAVGVSTDGTKVLIGEYGTSGADPEEGIWLWYSGNSGATWSAIYEQDGTFDHYHGPIWHSNSESFIVPFGDKTKGWITVDCSGASPSVSFLKDPAATGFQGLDGIDIPGTDNVLVAADASHQLAVMDVTDGSWEPVAQKWTRTYGFDSNTKAAAQYTYLVWTHNGLYYACEWLDGNFDGATAMCPVIVATNPYGPWSLVDWIPNIEALKRYVGVTGDGKMMFYARNTTYNATSDTFTREFREAYYMDPATVAIHEGVQLMPARTELHVANEASPPYADWKNATGTAYHEFYYHQPTPDRISTCTTTGGPGDNGYLTTIDIDATGGDYYYLSRCMLPFQDQTPEAAFDEGTFIQWSAWVKSQHATPMRIYFYRSNAANSAMGHAYTLPANKWVLLRSPAYHVSGTVAQRRIGPCYDIGTSMFISRDSSISWGRLWAEKAPGTHHIEVAGTRATTEYNQTIDVGSYWSHCFHYAPAVDGREFSGDAYCYGLLDNQKMLIRSWENAAGTSYIRLYWVWGRRSTVATRSIPGDDTATINTADEIFTDDMVGHWVTIHSDLDSDGIWAEANEFVRAHITSRTDADTIVCDDDGATGTLTTTNVPEGANLIVDWPHYELVVSDGSNTDTMTSGWEPLMLGTPIGFVVCVGDDDGNSGEVRAFVAAGGDAYEFTGSPTTNAYATLANIRLSTFYGDPDDTDDGMPGWLIEGGMFGHQDDAEAAALFDEIHEKRPLPGRKKEL